MRGTLKTINENTTELPKTAPSNYKVTIKYSDGDCIETECNLYGYDQVFDKILEDYGDRSGNRSIDYISIRVI